MPSQAELDEMKCAWCSHLEMVKTHSESDRAQKQHHGIDQTPAVDLHLESEAHGPQISELAGQSIPKAPPSEYSFSPLEYRAPADACRMVRAMGHGSSLHLVHQEVA